MGQMEEESVKRQKQFGVYLAVIALLIFPLGMEMWVQRYPINIQVGLGLQILLGALVGLFVPGLMLSWLLIGLTSIGIAILLFGYLLIPIPAKLLLLVAFPLIASLTTVLRSKLIEYRQIAAAEKEINQYLTERDPIVDLRTQNAAQRTYHISQSLLEEGKFVTSLDVTAIHWEHHRQYEQFHLREHNDFLKTISQDLKQHRLPSEQFFYLDDATFLIFSYNLTPSQIETLSSLTRQRLDKLAPENPKGIKIGRTRLTPVTATKYNFGRLLNHLVRKLETDILIEYLVEENDD